MKTKATVASRIVTRVLRDGNAVDVKCFSNIVTDYGLANWAKASLGKRLAIGSGSREEVGSITELVAPSATQLGALIASDVNEIDIDAGVMRSNYTLVVTFPPEAVNKNYSEIGIFGKGREPLQTYALIRDAFGEPVAQSVLAGEQFQVNYTLQFSLPLSSSFTKNAKGVPTTVTTVPISVGSRADAPRLPSKSFSMIWGSGQPVPTPESEPAGGTRAPNGSWVGDTHLLELGREEGNLDGGISLVQLGSPGFYIAIMTHYDPPLDKNSSTSLTLSHKIILTNGDFYGS